jgi:uncharacterized membrane protein (DUF485 family)
MIMNHEHNYNETINSPKFKQLVVKRWLYSLILTITILSVYFGFILIIAFNKELLALKIGKHLTLGIPVGLGIIIFAWALTGIYVFWANRYYDKSVSEIKDSIKKQYK